MKRISSRARWGLVGTAIAIGGITHHGDITPLPEPVPSTHTRPGRQPVHPRDFQDRFQQAFHAKDDLRRERDLSAIATQWTAANPEEALAFARQLADAETRTRLLRLLLTTWARHDPEAAMVWSDGLPDEAARRSARSTIAITLAETDPCGALDLAIRHGAANETGGLLENLAMQWADRESAPALEWVKTQPPGEWHDRLMARVAFILSKSDPRAAACQVAEAIAPGPLQDEAVISVLHQWALTDAVAAARWAESITAGALRERALGELAGLRPAPLERID
ncbi:hypothetical protein [Luteolibacter sp. LG18]|uniref:hypothetical protein n=1 Tax=Luteolibacter sp. LG18 TaxID=2819286 RepID=UPI002B2A846A|nr:hypothetical protein llg_41670 [Luteolibacter sp. LG18]